MRRGKMKKTDIMSLFQRRDDGASSDVAHSERKRDCEKFLDSLRSKTQLNLTNYFIVRWTVRGDYLYFIDMNLRKIVVNSIAQGCVERELQHEFYVHDFEFIGDIFLASVGAATVQVWNVSTGALLTSRKYQRKGIYTSCIVVSSTSFLYVSGDTIRHLSIASSHSSAAQLDQVNTATFDYNFMRPSEVCGGKIALVCQIKKSHRIFDVTTFKVTALFDISPHLQGFQIEYYRTFNVTFPDQIFFFCVGNSKQSKLKILILDPIILNLRKSIIIPNPIHLSLQRNPNLGDGGYTRIDANESNIQIQHLCESYYQILEISISKEEITNSHGFHVRKFISPNYKSLTNGIIVTDKDCHLIFREIRNEIQNDVTNSPGEIQGPIEQLYHECIQSGRRAIHFCEHLSSNLFDGSLFEFYCGHRLLMMAVQDRDIPKSLHYDDTQFKWHKAIYSASKNVKSEKPDDEKERTIILMEATECNVIEGVTHYLLANEILTEVREQNGKIFSMRKQLFVRLVQLEAAHMNLDIAFERYRKIQGMTELMGIALNVIPFLGGSLTAAVTAGAEIVEGLQISDALTGLL